MLICTRCRTKFLANEIKTHHTPQGHRYKMCPIIPCHGAVVDIDDALADILPRFWKIKIETQHSCSGHLWEGAMTPYVLFSFDKGRRCGVTQKTFDKRLHRFYHFYSLVNDAAVKKGRSPYYVIEVGKIQEMPEYSSHVLTPPGPCLRFNLSAKSKAGGYLGAIEAQAAYLKLLYELHSDMIMWDRVEKSKK